MQRAKTWCRISVAWGLAACSPVLDWRETQPPESAAVVMFPCKPDRFARSVTLGAEKVQMYLASCSAGGATYALSHAELSDPANITAALEALRAAAARNIGGQATVLAPMLVTGMTPHRLAERLEIQGRRPEGGVLREEIGVFTRGRRVYQASIVGDTLDRQAADIFFAGLKFPS
jgi:hypothetical protein